MKGLLCKDLAAILRPVNLAAAVLLMLVGMRLKVPFLLACIALLWSVQPVDIMLKDSVSRWEIQQMTLPVSRFRIVTEKYLLVLICAAVSCLLITAGMFRIALAYRLTAAETGFWIIRNLLSCIVIPAAVLPVSFRFGYQKGRGILFVLIVFFAVAAAAELSFPDEEYAQILTLYKLTEAVFPWKGHLIVYSDLTEMLDAVKTGKSTAAIACGGFGMILLSWLLSLLGFSRRKI